MGLWPAIWTVGNLGRAGYGATLEGIVRIHLSTVPLHPLTALSVAVLI